MYGSARSAYESGTKTTVSGRELEAAALYRAARKLEACQQAWGAPGTAESLAAALRNNQRLWTFFQGEWDQADCPLPAALRVNLLRLSAFVDRRTFEMLAAPTTAGIQPLVDIDRQLAAGLATPVPAPAGREG